jgi:hypothetical protein
MQIAKIENGKVAVIFSFEEFKKSFSNVSFPMTGPEKEFLLANSCLEVTVWKPTTETQKLVICEPYIKGDFVYTVKVVEKTSEEIEAENQSRLVKNQAN